MSEAIPATVKGTRCVCDRGPVIAAAFHRNSSLLVRRIADMGHHTAADWIVIEFDVPEGSTFEPMLRDLREFLAGDERALPRAIHGAIREAADRVLAALAPAPTEPEPEATDEGERKP